MSNDELIEKLKALKACGHSIEYVSSWGGTIEELWALLTGEGQEARTDMGGDRPVDWAWWLVSELGLGQAPAKLAAWRAMGHAVAALEAAGIDAAALKDTIECGDLAAAGTAAGAAWVAARTAAGTEAGTAAGTAAETAAGTEAETAAGTA